MESEQPRLTKIVVVLDSGLDLSDPRFSEILCPYGHKDFTGYGIKDELGHGTHVLGLIKKYAPQHGWCAVIVKTYDKNNSNDGWITAVSEAFKYLYVLKPDYVNYSGGGFYQLEEERVIIKHLEHRTKFIVAAGNQGNNLEFPYNNYFPAKYNLPNIVPVGNILNNGQRQHQSNYGLPNMKWEKGTDVLSTVPDGKVEAKTGTSMSCAIYTGKLLSKEIDVDKHEGL